MTGSTKPSAVVAICLLLSGWVPAAAVSLADPLVDTGLTVVTPRPDVDLVVVRERYHSTPGVDLTPYGIGSGADDFVQSIYFRLYPANTGGLEDTIIATVTFPAGVQILGYITQPASLGAGSPGGPYAASDALFAVAANPDDYAANLRGFEPPGASAGAADFICPINERSFRFALDVTGGMDDFRVIVDYGSSFAPDLTFQVTVHEDRVRNIPGARGMRLGGSGGVPGEGDYGEIKHLVRIPLTTDTLPLGGTIPPVSGGDVIYMSRETGADPFLDGFDVRAEAAVPSLTVIPAGAVLAPRAVAFGQDGLLYVTGDEFGFASIDTVSGSVTNIGVPDEPGSIVRMTALQGDDRLFFVRQTSFPDPENAWVDTWDPVSGYVPNVATFPTNTLRGPVDIIAAGDGFLYTLEPGANLHRVNPANGAITLNAVPFTDLTGNNVKGTADPFDTSVYLLRDTTGSTFVDRLDVVTGAFTPAVVTVASNVIAEPAAVVIDNEDMMWVIGKNGGLVGIDHKTPGALPFYQTTCLDYDGFVNHATIPRVPREVSPPGTSRFLDVTLSPSPGLIRLSWEDIASGGLSYNVYEGALGGYYTHASLTCHTAGTPDGGGSLFEDVPGTAGPSVYYLVTASSRSGEGSAGRSSSGVNRPLSVPPPSCGPMP